MVLVNPGFSDVRIWESTVEWLAQIARVTTFDYRDTGLSSLATEPYSEIDDIAAVLDAAGVETAVMLGVSDGARRTLSFAHQHPERVRKAIAVGGAFGDFPDPSPEEDEARRVMHEHFARREKALAAGGIGAAADMDVRGWAPKLDTWQHRKMVGMAVQSMYLFTLENEDYLGTELDPGVKHRFHEITVPISVLVGGHDFTATQLWARRIAAEAPNATLTRFADSDHFPMLSAPEQFERFVREQLA